MRAFHFLGATCLQGDHTRAKPSSALDYRKMSAEE
jgi:hypothetical protein